MVSTVDELASMPLETALSELGSARYGLDGVEARRRLAEVGPNALPEARRNPVLEFLGYFWAPIPWMIEAALVLSLLVGHWADAAIIAVLLLMNGVVAFFEEHQAAGAIAALKDRLARNALVRRDGEWSNIAVSDLVPGDVIRIQLGDVVPADARILDDTSVEVDQSTLTGESLPVLRGRGDVVPSGSVVVRGVSDALVYATGRSSLFGRTAELVATAGTVSHFQRAVLRIGNYLIVLALALVILTTVVSLLRGNPALETLAFALVVTIAAVPVALPAVLTVTMAIGARRLAREKAVVTHLPAVEELGGMDVLCSDKTGTLTENALAVAECWLPPSGTRDQLFETAALASLSEGSDAIDRAVLAASPPPVGYHVDEFVPFDPVVKRSEATVTLAEGTSVSATKGAPQVIGSLCAHDPAAARLAGVVDDFADQGYRSLAVARRVPADGQWCVVGVLALADPPRSDSASTITEARALGIDVKMVTGDQVAIGREVARRIGLGEDIRPAEVLTALGPDDAALADTVESVDGFAQVVPEHKHLIVRSLQFRGHIVGMTGDGVNDAPALQQADAGIAVSGATDASRAAADIVLLAPGLSVIVRAVRQAREIFSRMTSYATYRIAETIRVLLLICLAIVVMNFYPVTAVMIVFLALLNDGAILAIAYDRVRAAARPAAWDMRSVLILATTIGVLGVAETFLLFAFAHGVIGVDEEVIRSLIYLKLSVSGHLTIFVTRTRGPFWSRPRPAPVLAFAVIGTQVIATLIAVHGLLMTPLGWGWAVAVWVYALAWFLVEDRVKLLAVRRLHLFGGEVCGRADAAQRRLP
ncbi:plasma-membrane proton-efflux P-type ATPase [Rhodococcus spongiicola]|uniref:Plasma-membrane proton-efflux P-type ATPase n=1 Tax=Rhodococcus spongiicola TaxID=2487352 RepID=A0A438B1W9_9NOCA|nr:plasma-membrane proton-efflux P-type ATPase [Rhodococcus spongiicola]RVW04906.1 plasma-membrane proton-efflux P-type ATPase [Rhodococcus spongiicola]